MCQVDELKKYIKMIEGNYTVADKCKFIIFQKTNNLSSLSSTFLIHMPRFFMLMLCIFC